MRFLLTPAPPETPGRPTSRQPVLTLPDGRRYRVSPLPETAKILQGRPLLVESDAAPTPEQVQDALAALALPQPPPVPEVITPAQLRVWLIRHSIPLSAVDDAIAALPAGQVQEEARARWEYSTEIHRDNPLVAGIAAALQMDGPAVDAAFRAAALL